MVKVSTDDANNRIDANKSVSSLMFYPADRDAPEDQRRKEPDDSPNLMFASCAIAVKQFFSILRQARRYVAPAGRSFVTN